MAFMYLIYTWHPCAGTAHGVWCEPDAGCENGVIRGGRRRPEGRAPRRGGGATAARAGRFPKVVSPGEAAGRRRGAWPGSCACARICIHGTASQQARRVAPKIPCVAWRCVRVAVARWRAACTHWRRLCVRMLGRIGASVPAVASASVCGCALPWAGCRGLVVGAGSSVLSVQRRSACGVRVRRVKLSE